MLFKSNTYNKKYSSLLLRSIVILLIVCGASSCTSCDLGQDPNINPSSDLPSGNHKVAKLRVAAKNTHLSASNTKGEVVFKLENGDKDIMVLLKDYQVKIYVTGQGKITIDKTHLDIPSGVNMSHPLHTLLGLKENAYIKGGEEQILEFHFVPDAGSDSMTVTFQVEEINVNEVGNIMVQYEAVEDAYIVKAALREKALQAAETAKNARRTIEADLSKKTAQGFIDALSKVTEAKEALEAVLAAKKELGDNSVDEQVSGAKLAYEEAKVLCDTAIQAEINTGAEASIKWVQEVNQAYETLVKELSYKRYNEANIALGRLEEKRRKVEDLIKRLGDSLIPKEIKEINKLIVAKEEEAREVYNKMAGMYITQVYQGKTAAESVLGEVKKQLNDAYRSADTFTTLKKVVNRAEAAAKKAEEAIKILGLEGDNSQEITQAAMAARQAAEKAKKKYDEEVRIEIASIQEGLRNIDNISIRMLASYIAGIRTLASYIAGKEYDYAKYQLESIEKEVGQLEERLSALSLAKVSNPAIETAKSGANELRNKAHKLYKDALNAAGK